MFENLSNRLSNMIHRISNRSFLTENNIKEILHEVRTALLEADVALPVVRNFVEKITKESIGKEIHEGLTSSQEFIKIVYSALSRAMGEDHIDLNLSSQPPVVILVVGLQGSGKTTTVAKLAKYLWMKKKKRALLASVDIYRASGMNQLEILATNANISFFSIKNAYQKTPVDIAKDALLQARLSCYDVLLIDTSGCLSTDETIISEIVDVHAFTHPMETLFIVDAMLGQESANSAGVFSNVLPLTGIILTKVDGDARGGAALSMYHIIGQPIKFIGTGEKIDALEPFYANRIAGRILGMGDALSLIEDIENKIEHTHIQNTLKKLNQGSSFDLFDFLGQLQQIRSMGSVNQILDKLPVVNNFSKSLQLKINDKMLITMEVIINSMTIQERKCPEVINGSRKRRISNGAGVSVQEVNMLLKRFDEMRFIMKKINKTGVTNMIRTLKNKISSGFFTH